jgi:hypothetical protein
VATTSEAPTKGAGRRIALVTVLCMILPLFFFPSYPVAIVVASAYAHRRSPEDRRWINALWCGALVFFAFLLFIATITPASVHSRG